MNVTLTSGMFGDPIISIGSNLESMNAAFELVQKWTRNSANQKRYKIEPYMRIISDKENKRLAIDFGDYATFIMIDNISAKRFDEFHSNN